MNKDSINHSVFVLSYHLVLVTKRRVEVIDNKVSKRLKEIFEKMQNKYNITLQIWDRGKDHIHTIFQAHPNTELAKFIAAYKSASSRLIKKEFPEIKEQLWSSGYCICTTGGLMADKIIRDYIYTI